MSAASCWNGIGGGGAAAGTSCEGAWDVKCDGKVEEEVVVIVDGGGGGGGEGRAVAVVVADGDGTEEESDWVASSRVDGSEGEASSEIGATLLGWFDCLVMFRRGGIGV